MSDMEIDQATTALVKQIQRLQPWLYFDAYSEDYSKNMQWYCDLMAERKVIRD